MAIHSHTNIYIYIYIGTPPKAGYFIPTLLAKAGGWEPCLLPGFKVVAVAMSILVDTASGRRCAVGFQTEVTDITLVTSVIMEA